MKPKRIQLRRSKGFRLPKNTVKVARPTKWGNPWRVGLDGDAQYVVEAYRRFVEGHLQSFPTIKDVRKELRGKNLACFCKLGQPCHGDVLLKIANQ